MRKLTSTSGGGKRSRGLVTLTIARVIALLLLMFMAILLPGYLHRMLDPAHGPMRSVYRPPPPAPLEDYVLVIRAGSEEEAFYLLGKAHAYYRFFQMDLMRRLVEGRLSELLGEQALELDVYFRTRGLYLWAQRSWDYIKQRYPHVARIVEAYTRGVNDYLAENPPILEYLVLGKIPEPWSPVDSIAIGKLIAWNLSGGEDDLELLNAVGKLGMSTIRELGVFERPLNTPILSKRVYFADLNTRRLMLGLSNNWVVHGNFTETGKPILANDPHLSLTAPPIWILQHVETPTYNVKGVAFPGVPFVVIGRSQHIAWGFTNTGVDVIDYYYYSWKDGKYYYNGSWMEPRLRVEEVKVCDLDNRCEVRRVEVLETVHGPLITWKGERYAMRWLGNNVTLEAVALYYMGKAKNLDEFKEALRFFTVPSQNTVYADVYGNIAYFAIGYLPIRSGGYLPFNGSALEGEWKGFYWLPEYFNAVNVPYVVTANNKIAEANIYVAWRWADRYRHDRISELLADKIKEKGFVSVRDIMEIQLDVVDRSCTDVIRLLPDDEFKRRLASWDCRMGVGSVEASLYATFLFNLQKAVWEKYGISPRFFPLEITLMAFRIGLANSSAIEEAKGKAVEKPWGSIHVYAIEHPLGSVLPQLNYPRVPAPGDWFTVNVAPGYPNPEGVYEVKAGPSLRFVADLSSDRAYFVIPGGPDGDPLSPLYYAMYNLWTRGEYVSR